MGYIADNTNLWLQKSPIGRAINQAILLPIALKVRWWLLKRNLIHMFSGQKFLIEIGILRFESPCPLLTFTGYTEETRIRGEKSPVLDAFVNGCTDLEEYYERTGH